MAVEIIKDAPKRFVMECEKCETQFMYSLSDCERKGFSYYIKCPWCEARLSHIKRIREVPKQDIINQKIELLKDFCDDVRQEFSKNNEMYFGCDIREVLKKKCYLYIKDIKDDRY